MVPEDKFDNIDQVRRIHTEDPSLPVDPRVYPSLFHQPTLIIQALPDPLLLLELSQLLPLYSSNKNNIYLNFSIFFNIFFLS
jgi:hypothetical protein